MEVKGKKSNIQSYPKIQVNVIGLCREQIAESSKEMMRKESTGQTAGNNQKGLEDTSLILQRDTRTSQQKGSIRYLRTEND